jgi:hypothetical protein
VAKGPTRFSREYLITDLPGQWNGIVFNESSFNNKLLYTTIKGMSSGISIKSTNANQDKIKFLNSQIGISYNNLISNVNSKIEAYNSVFYCAESSILNIVGGHSNFIHCTIANLYPFGTTSNPAVLISNFIENNGGTNSYPVEMAQFTNSIIWGNRGNEVEISSVSSENKVSNYKFDYSLLKSPQTDDSRFSNVIFNENPKFTDTNNKYSFDFRISSDSPARGKAWNFNDTDYKYDIFGTIRELLYDIGAYQYKE